MSTCTRMGIRTYHTAFAFLVASWLTQGSWLQHWLSTLACSSILVHAGFEASTSHGLILSGWPILVHVDSALAHVMFARTVHHAWTIPWDPMTRWPLALYYVCMAHVATVYLWKIRHVAHIQHGWHGTMHLAGAIGCVTLHVANNYNKSV